MMPTLTDLVAAVALQHSTRDELFSAREAARHAKSEREKAALAVRVTAAINAFVNAEHDMYWTADRVQQDSKHDPPGNSIERQFSAEPAAPTAQATVSQETLEKLAERLLYHSAKCKVADGKRWCVCDWPERRLELFAALAASPGPSHVPERTTEPKASA